jgi:dynactin complex subunit
MYYGVELETPIGSHNGTFKDKEYFKTGEKMGMFVQISCAIKIEKEKVIKKPLSE